MITEVQREGFRKMYMNLPQAEICRRLKMTMGQLTRHINCLTIEEVYECDYFKNKKQLEVGNILINEPTLSEIEEEVYEMAKGATSTTSTLVDSREEIINGQRCIVFQSRINYE